MYAGVPRNAPVSVRRAWSTAVGDGARRRRPVEHVGGRLFLADPARQPEVHHAHGSALADHDVLRLEIAVHQPGCMRAGQSAPGGQEDLQHLPPAGPRCRASRPFGDGHPIDELHRDEDAVADGPDVVDRNHVFMRQAGNRFRFPAQPRRMRRAPFLAVRMQDLERHAAVQLRISGGVDVTHAAASDQPQHHVPASPRPGRQGRRRCRHVAVGPHRGRRARVRAGGLRQPLVATGTRRQVTLDRRQLADGNRPGNQPQNGVFRKAAHGGAFTRRARGAVRGRHATRIQRARAS